MPALLKWTPFIALIEAVTNVNHGLVIFTDELGIEFCGPMPVLKGRVNIDYHNWPSMKCKYRQPQLAIDDAPRPNGVSCFLYSKFFVVFAPPGCTSVDAHSFTGFLDVREHALKLIGKFGQSH